MLITLVSDETTPTAGESIQSITNDFPSGLTIQPHTDVSLVSMAYNLTEGFTVGATNNLLRVKFGFMPNEVLVTIPQAVYRTIDELAAAVQVQLRAVVTASIYNNFTFDATDILCTSPSAGLLNISMSSKQDGTKNVVTFTPLAASGNTVNCTVGAKYGAGNGGFYRADAAGGATNDIWSSYTVGKDFYAFAQALDTDGNHYLDYFFEVGQNNAIVDIAWDTDRDQDISHDLKIKFRLTQTGTIQIFEMGTTGVVSNIAPTAPAPTYIAGDKFRIRVPQLIKNGDDEVAVYSKLNTTSGDYETIGIAGAGATRHSFTWNQEYYAKGCINTGSTYGRLLSVQNDLAGVISTFSIQQAGTDYQVGEVLTMTGGTGTGASFYVTSIDANGGITAVDIVAPGDAYTVADLLTGTGQFSQSADARITVDFVDTAVTLISGGTGYAAGGPHPVTGGSGAGATATIVAAPAGVVTQFSVTSVGSGYVKGDTLTINSGGADCTFSVISVEADIINVGNVLCGLTERDFAGFIATPNNYFVHPLARQEEMYLDPSTFGVYANITGVVAGDRATPINVTSADGIESDLREQNTIHVHLMEGEIESREKGAEGKCVHVLQLGSNDNTHAGLYFYQAYNLIYHKLSNEQKQNHNQMTVRFTDAENRPLQHLSHPVKVTLDIRPRAA